MKSTTLKQKLRKIYAQRLVFPAIILIVTIVLLIWNPFEKKLDSVPVDNLSQLEEIYDSGKHYIHYTADTLYYTGQDYYVNDKARAGIYYTIDNGKCYFFIISSDKIPDNHDEIHDMTVYARLTYNDSMYKRIIASMSESLHFSMAALEDVSTPVLINQYDFAHGFTTFFLVCIIILNIVFFIQIAAIIVIIISPVSSPSVLRLGKYGNHRTLFAIAETEFDSAKAVGHKNLYITDTFLIYFTRTSLDIIPLENIVWVYNYKEVLHNKDKAKTRAPLCIVTDTHKLYKIHHISKTVSDRIIEIVQERFPEIMVGID